MSTRRLQTPPWAAWATGLSLLLGLTGCGGGGGSNAEAAGVGGGSGTSPVTATPPAGWMRVAQGELRSASGQAVLLRGINLQFGDEPGSRLAGIAAIAEQGANAVRLQLRRNTTAAELRAALEALRERGLVAIPMYWETDVTCTHDTAGLATALNRWTQTWREVLADERFRGMLVLNIANEWGRSSQLADWRSRMADAIVQIRAAGLAMPLMVDAPDCGQAAFAFDATTTAALLAADPHDNLVLSVHAYWSYQTAARIGAAVDTVRATGLPMVWGEFGQRAFQADIGQATDHLALMHHANQQGVGYLAWSWFGNGPEAAVLDMATAVSGGQLTAYGREVIDGAVLNGQPVAGLRATSVRMAP